MTAVRVARARKLCFVVQNHLAKGCSNAAPVGYPRWILTHSGIEPSCASRNVWPLTGLRRLRRGRRMLSGNVGDLYVVRQYLDAQRGRWA